MYKAIVNGQIVAGDRLLQGQALVYDSLIRKICPQNELAALPIAQVDDAHGLLVSPGLIDTHIHGLCGADVMDCNQSSLAAIGRALVQHGVTSWLPTTMTAPWEQIAGALSTVRSALTCVGRGQDDSQIGAQILGVHLEGPFLSRRFCGAHNARYLLAPDATKVLCHRDLIRLVTYAPELDRDQLFAQQLLQGGIVPSIGHTASDYATTRRALTAGVNHATHLFNAMPPLHHRQPGPLGAILEAGIHCELIADGLHLHESVYQLALRAIGLERVVLISDSMRAAGLDDGSFDLGGQTVYVQQGEARLADGALAGSVITLNQAVRNFQAGTGLSIAQALRAATLNPANLLGLAGQKGSLTPGSDADIVVFDAELRAQLTIVQGQIAFRRA
ncbi:MAG: N-acetylglucosamine-6-phosphate deacetylase [Bacillota bacterium]|jgi:N-acetylglucosamine-6-phosphate deacetylase